MLGNGLTSVTYVLDEPSIGLHPRDQARLIGVLRELRDRGNTVIAVEHDDATMRACDYLVDIGPRAGKFGGNVIYAGDLNHIVNLRRRSTISSVVNPSLSQPRPNKPTTDLFISKVQKRIISKISTSIFP